jgi:predicted alpha/beta-fold hydrolase
MFARFPMPIIDETGYRPPPFLSNPHLGTIVPYLVRLPFTIQYDRERVLTPDGDFIDLDWSTVVSKKLIIFSHGLEGSSKSTYIVGMAKYFNKRGYDTVAWNFRSCSGTSNWTVPFYHPGQTGDLQLVVDTATQRGYQEIYLIGFSIGGALTLRYLGERGDRLHTGIKKAVVFSVPTDISASIRRLSEGNQALYGNMFLASYRKKMQIKAKGFPPNTYDLKAWDQVKTLSDFDDVFNAPWHNLPDREAFYRMVTSKPLIPSIRIPTLIINAMTDPFLTPSCFPFEEAYTNPHLFLEVPELGGHLGFMMISRKGICWSETRAEAFLKQD